MDRSDEDAGLLHSLESSVWIQACRAEEHDREGALLDFCGAPLSGFSCVAPVRLRSLQGVVLSISNCFRAGDSFGMTTASNDIAITSKMNPAQEVAPSTEAHPNILLVRWEIAVRAMNWALAIDIAKALIVALPTEPIGWIYHAFAEQQMGLILEARRTLLAGARKLPADWRIAYNIACYNAQLGDVAGAWNWLERAFELGDATIIKPLAAEEPSLKPLWQPAGLRVGRDLNVSAGAQRPESESTAFAA